jgi:hypothetical protein
LLILDLWGISFHAVVVFGLGKNLLFKSVLGHCDDCSISFKERFSENFDQKAATHLIFCLGTKVIYTKYSKHWPYTVAHTFECVCIKC